MRAPPDSVTPGAWCVAFVPSDQLTGDARAWWRRLLSPRRQHVFAFRAAGAHFTELVNHAGSHLDISVLPEPIEALQDTLARCGIEMLAVAQPAATPRAMLRGPMTCVEVVKALIGLRAPHVLTPEHLARYLRARGARVIRPSQKEAA